MTLPTMLAATADVDWSTVLLALATAGGFLGSIVLALSSRKKSAAETDERKAAKDLALANTQVAMDLVQDNRITRLVTTVKELRDDLDLLDSKHETLTKRHETTREKLDEAKEEIGLLKSTIRRMRKHGVAVAEWYAAYSHRFPEDVPDMPLYEDTFVAEE